MTAVIHELEPPLIGNYQKQLPLYQRALAIAERQETGALAVAGNDWVRGLNCALEEIASLDAALAADKNAWRLSGQQPGPELSALLMRVAEYIKALSGAIDRHVAQIQERKEKLMPALDKFIQQRRMLEAYGSYGERQSRNCRF
jgi:hypothetical protein